MYFYWAIIAPILPGLAIFLGAALIKEKKRVGLVFLGILCVFNIYISFNLINIFRRDYNGDFSIFPLSNYLAYIIIINVVFLSVSLLLLMKLDSFKENRLILGVQSFFYKIKDNILLLEKTTDKLLAIFLLFCLFYIIGILNLYIHEFGHAMADIIFGTYYNEIRINFFLQGWTSGGGILATDEFHTQKVTGILLGGLFSECIFTLFSLIIILWKEEKNNFTWLLSIVISMLFLNRVALYFTFPQLLNIRSDVLGLVSLGYDPRDLFYIFFPFLIITIVITSKLISKLYKTSLNRNKLFLGIYFISLTLYIVVLVILSVINEFVIPLESLSFY